MLEIIRKNSQSFVTKVMIFLIAAVFIFWGGSSNFDKNSRNAATVNGKDISLGQFGREYESAVEFYRQSGNEQTPENFKEQVLYQLILRELMRQGAEQLGLEVSDQAVQKYIIATLSSWTGNTNYNEQDYKRFLVQQKISAINYETRVRNELLISRVATVLESLSAVSQQEKELLLDYINQEVKLTWAVFKSADYVPVDVAEKDLQAWYDKHKERYRSQPERKLHYLFFSKEDAIKEAGITEERVAQYYQDTMERYRQDEERRARMLLFLLAENADQKTRAKKKAQAQEALVKIKEGADFAQMVGQYSEDPAAKMNGGDLGFYSRKALAPIFGDVVFSLQPSQVSEVVESPVGYVILKLEEVRPEKLQTLDELRATIRSELETRAAEDLVAEKAKAAYEGILKAGSLTKYSEQSGTTIKQTEFFKQDEPPDKALDDPAPLQALFALGKGELSSIITTANGAAICLIEDSKGPALQDLAVMREQALADFRLEKSVELARAAAEALLVELRDKKAWPATTARQESAYLKRTQPIEELPRAMVEDVFQHMATGFLPQKALDVSNDFYVYQLTDMRKSPEALADNYLQEINQQILTTRKREVIADWTDTLFQQAEIWTNKEQLR